MRSYLVLVPKWRASESGHGPAYVFTTSLEGFAVDDRNWVAEGDLARHGPVGV
jgi:hypothetical protein